MAHVFISYSNLDLEFARFLKTLLEAQKITVWMDETKLAASSRWWRTIEESIDTCDGMIVVMSPNSAESDWVERELLRAEKMKRPIFPVLLEGEAWSRLANLQYADMRGGVHAMVPQDLVAGLKLVSAGETEAAGVALRVEPGDVLTFHADALVLKYAQSFYGTDRAVFRQLVESLSHPSQASMPEVGRYVIVASRGSLNVEDVLFVGVPNLLHFDYRAIRKLAQDALRMLAVERPNTTHLAMTIHGVGFGLDETESIRAQVAGFSEAITLGQFPLALRRITIIDIDEARVRRLRAVLDDGLRERDDFAPLSDAWGYTILPRTDGKSISTEKSPPYAYVCMPDDPALEDVFYYGIQGAVHAAGLLCVRVEGDVNNSEVIKQSIGRLRDARLVIAEVSEPMYPLYVQIGYALGKGCPLVGVTRSGDSLRWPIPHNIVYTSIKGLERQMAELLAKLDLT